MTAIHHCLGTFLLRGGRPKIALMNGARAGNQDCKHRLKRPERKRSTSLEVVRGAATLWMANLSVIPGLASRGEMFDRFSANTVPTSIRI